MNRTSSFALIAATLSLAGAAARAQDSVSNSPGDSDALSPFATQRTRYVLDLVPLTSSWNNSFGIGPILKSGRDEDPLFPSLLLGPSCVSADQLNNVTITSANYSVWTTAGQGVNSGWNDPAPTIPVTGYTRQFGVAFNDLSSTASDITGAIVGQDASNPMRLFVFRVQAINSRQFAVDSPETCTVSLGSLDASGNVMLRADPFGATSFENITGENIVRVALASRSGAVNRLRNPTGTLNIVSDTAASAYVINNGSVTTNPPTSLPASLAGSAFGLILDFSNKFRANGAAGISTHIASGLTTHRGNPTFSTITDLGGVGAVASLARSSAGAGKVDSLNLFAVNATGTPSNPRGATLPAPITAGSFTANSAGNAQFQQYLSQLSFRGPSGQVGLGRDPGLNAPVAAAVATDPTAGQFVAVARFVNPTPTWTVAGWVGKPVRNGPTGAIVGNIIAGSPTTFSMPAVDLFGNVYFVARYQPVSGSPTTALIKAVNVAGSEPYPLELLLAAGQSFTGANSTRPYTIQSITLADSDSVASGAFNGGSVHQGAAPGGTASTASSSFAFGGCVVNAQIVYDNAGIPESSQAVLFIAPRAAVQPPVCPGDANGDHSVGLADIAVIIQHWAQTVPPGTNGDLSLDGSVGLADIAIVIQNWGVTCP